MKPINQYIQEKFIINKNNKSTHKYFPKTKEELRKILEERLKKDSNADLNDINISGITDMGPINDIGLFEYLDPHNIDISEWDVSKVENMHYMFYNCRNFNSDLSKWVVSKVTDMTSMFYECKIFNCDLSKWNVSNVTHMSNMFYGCRNFNSDLSKWNVSNVTDKRFMLFDCTSLKNIPTWYKK